MCRIKILIIAIGVTGICSLPCFADEPTTQPAANLVDSPDSVISLPGPSGVGDDGVPRRRGDHMRPNQRTQVVATPKDVTDAMRFMQENSPKRFEAIQSLQEGKNKDTIKTITARAYLNWTRQKKDDPELYAIIVQRIHIEDGVFGLLSQLRSEPPDSQAPTKALLKEQVAKLFDVGIQERATRLDRLTRTVQAEQKNLVDDTANRDKLVSERLETIINDKRGLLPTPNLNDGGGPGKSGPGGRDRGGPKVGGNDNSNP